MKTQLDELRALFDVDQVISTLKGIPALDARTLLEVQAGAIVRVNQELEHTKQVLQTTLEKFSENKSTMIINSSSSKIAVCCDLFSRRC